MVLKHLQSCAIKRASTIEPAEAKAFDRIEMCEKNRAAINSELITS